jgi:multiple sugar transport system permease protein
MSTFTPVRPRKATVRPSKFTPIRSKARLDTVANPRRSPVLTLVMVVLLVYSLLPLAWLVVNATKSQAGLFSSFGLWFAHDFSLFPNIGQTLTYDDGIFLRWLGNTLLYVVVGAGGATALATLGGYGLARYAFPGRRLIFAIILGAVAVPGTALAVPTFLLFSDLGLTNTPWSVILPSLVTPFGFYLMWTFSAQAIPVELIEAARIDGAREITIFTRVCLPLLAPGIVTVLLFTSVATWNNYFLPFIMLKDPNWYPLTIGLDSWNEQGMTAGGHAIFNLVITGSLLTILPLIAAFLFLQRFWQSGLAAGSVKY